MRRTAQFLAPPSGHLAAYLPPLSYGDRRRSSVFSLPSIHMRASATSSPPTNSTAAMPLPHLFVSLLCQRVGVATYLSSCSTDYRLSASFSRPRKAAPPHILDPALPFVVILDWAQVMVMGKRGGLVLVMCTKEQGRVRRMDMGEDLARPELQRRSPVRCPSSGHPQSRSDEEEKMKDLEEV